MGNCASSENEHMPNSGNLCFTKCKAIGKGSYGKVWKVIHEPTGKEYAMKEMSKSLIIKKKSAPFIMNERRLLAVLHHPFLVNLHLAYQDNLNLYLVVDLKEGGDLRYFFTQNQNIPENSIKFMAACIITALDYLHSNKIIHRDLKPENLVFDQQGYLHLTDFGIARSSEQDNSGIISGTPGYMSPEIMCIQNHSCVSDYFSLGVILFEATTGARPYWGSSRKEIRDNILNKQVKMPESCSWSKELRDFVNKLIIRKPERRLGAGGISQLKNHPWFNNFDWEKLYSKSSESPIKISGQENYDKRQVEEKFSKPSQIDNQKIFSGFFFQSGQL